MFFFNNKEEIVKKSKALVGRENQINIDLRNEINGTDFREIPENFKTIIIGMGCFWGAERIFWQLEGVYHTSVGYAGGHTKNPTYEEVCSGLTGHTEVVRVVYNPKKISLRKILIAFWEGHDPTQGMRQGNDIGTQYRSAIYLEENQDIKEVKKTMLEFQNLLEYDVEFYFAEAYHQQYLYKNPNGYCGLGGGGVRFK
jgi:peptide-methionine (S)-S-oxide reductase